MTTALQPSRTLQPSRYLQPARGGGVSVTPEGAEQLFRTTGHVRPNTGDTTRYRINGAPLENAAIILGADDGLLSPPNQPDAVVKVPGRHGAIDVGGTVGTSQITFNGYILGVDPTTGQWNPGESFGTYMARVDELMRLLTARRLTIEAVRPDGGTRQATGRLLGSLAPAQSPADPWFGRFRATIRIPAGFWEDTAPVTQTITGPTGTDTDLDAFAAATAPIADLTITIPGPCSNPLLIHGDTTFSYQGVITAGRQLVVNTGDWTVSSGTGTPWSPDLRQISFGPGPAWFELDPTLRPFTASWNHTGGGQASCSITGRRTYYNP